MNTQNSRYTKLETKRNIAGIDHQLIKKEENGYTFFVDDLFLYALENFKNESIIDELVNKFSVSVEEARMTLKVILRLELVSQE